MFKKLIWPVFGIMVCAQLAVPAWMVIDKELALVSGKQLRVRCAVRDPYDLFRGRYVALRFDIGPITTSKDWNPPEAKTRYLSYSVDEKGFLRGEKVSTSPPDGDYIRLGKDTHGGELPCDRFYMNEELAPRADRFLRTNRNTIWASVRLRHGDLMLEEIYVDDVPLARYLEEHPDAGTNATIPPAVPIRK